MACTEGNFSIAQILVNYRANVNIPDEVRNILYHVMILFIHTMLSQFGATPLMVASMKGYEEICDLLLQHGASVTITDNVRPPTYHIMILPFNYSLTESSMCDLLIRKI